MRIAFFVEDLIIIKCVPIDIPNFEFSVNLWFEQGNGLQGQDVCMFSLSHPSNKQNCLRHGCHSALNSLWNWIESRWQEDEFRKSIRTFIRDWWRLDDRQWAGQEHGHGQGSSKPLTHQLKRTQQRWLFGPQDSKMCSTVALTRTLWSVLIALLVIVFPILVVKTLPNHKTVTTPIIFKAQKSKIPHPHADNYTHALHKALLFFNAQKCKVLSS